MFLTILLAIFVILALLTGVAAARYKPTSGQAPKGAVAIIPTVFVILSLVVGFFAFTYKVDEGEAVALRSVSGRIVAENTSPGYAIKAPWSKPLPYQTRNLRATFAGDIGLSIKDGNITSGQFVAQTSDGATARFDLTVAYTYDGEQVKETYQDFGRQDALIENRVLPAISSEVPKVVATFSTDTFRNSRGPVSVKALEALNERLNSVGITVQSVDVRGIRFSETVEARFDDLTKAATDIEIARNAVQVAQLDAEQKRIEALANADADQIERCGATTTTVTETIGGVDQEVTRAVPVPNEQCQNILNEQTLRVRELDALREIGAAGNLIVVGGGEGNTLLNIPTDK